jgi:hypothetical protein
MKVTFENRMEAIDWIAAYAEDEGQFEVLREQLNFNYIYTQSYFLDLSDPIAEVVLNDRSKAK